ncbi:MAG: CBS domain-containing protein, partial [archaeon]|nr:CBS domain-containing protein [archaeon]
LIKLHTTEAIEQLKREEEEANIGDDVGLTNDQVNVMLGALDVTNKSVKDFMVPYENVYNISIDEPLTESVLKKIMNKGFSRIPVYKGDPHQVIGLLRVKQLLNLKIDYTQNKSLKDLGVKLNHPLVVSPEMKAIDLLHEFKKGKSHMAFITYDVLTVQQGCGLNKQNSFKESLEQLKYDNLGASYFDQPEKKVEILGILTLADVIEKMISIEIMDEDDYNKAKRKKKKALLKQKTAEAAEKEIVKNIQTQSLVESFIEGNKEKLGNLIDNPKVDESEKQPLNNEMLENEYQLLNNQI